MLKHVVIFSLIAVQVVFAIEGDVSKVVKLANTVKSVAFASEASQENIDEAEAKLREVIELLTSQSSSSGRGGSSQGEFGSCYDFAYQKYYISLSSSNAADKASAVCKVGIDLEVAKFLYEKYYISLSAVNAMDKAAKGAEKGSRGKLQMIKYMYEKYYISLNSANAADKAVEGASKLKKNGQGCIEKLYASYYVSQSAANAMNSAVTSCAK